MNLGPRSLCLLHLASMCVTLDGQRPPQACFQRYCRGQICHRSSSDINLVSLELMGETSNPKKCVTRCVARDAGQVGDLTVFNGSSTGFGSKKLRKPQMAK
jgi:hypothetical protein